MIDDEANMDDVTKRLVALLAEQFDIAARIDADSSLKEDLGLDSVAMIELIGAIEADLGMEFQDSDLRGSVFATVGTLAAVVASRLQG
jgi:acyl carrier protein